MKPIPQFENYKVDKNGFIYSKSNRILIPINRNGYLGIRLSKNSHIYYRNIHRVVYEAFKGPIPNNMHINHINGISIDNRLSNLEVCTPQENQERRLNLLRGTAVNTAKLTEEEVMDIRRRKRDGESSLVLAKEYGLYKSSINKIVRGYSWKHLPILNVDLSVWGNKKLTGSISGKSLAKKYGQDYFSKITKHNKFKKHCKTCICEI